MFLLLLALLMPVDVQVKYNQRSSIHKLLLRSSKSYFEGKYSAKWTITDWLQTDFIHKIYSEEESEEGIGFTTGCVLINNGTVRIFRTTPSEDFICDIFAHKESGPTHNNVSSDCGLRIFNGINGIYFEENKIVMDEDKSNALFQIDEFSQLLSNISSGAIGVEFFLFNPSLSLLNSIQIYFEFTEKSVLRSSEITSIKIIDMNCSNYFVKFTFHLIFLLFVLMNWKDQCWQLLKYRQVYLKDIWSHFAFIYNIFSVYYLFSYFSFIMQLKIIAHHLNEYNLNVYITDAALLENLCQNLLGLLIFFHLIELLRILEYSYRLKRIFKRLIDSWKMLLMTVVVITFLLGICDIMRRTFSDKKKSSRHPMLVCLGIISAFFKNYQKPEIVKESVGFEKYFSALSTFVFIALYFYLFAFIKSVLIGSNCPKQSVKDSRFNLKESRKVINKKIKEMFLSERPEVVLKENYVLPVEFLLLELEELGDKLLKKADAIFSKENALCVDHSAVAKDVDEFIKSHFEIFHEEFKPNTETTDVVKEVENCGFKPLTISEANVVKILNATVPKHRKLCGKKLLPTSLNASLASQRKFRYQDVNLSASLQCHKIRKTYPLQLHSDASSETYSSSEKVIPNFTLRKTKSKGKGKSCDLDLNITDDATV